MRRTTTRSGRRELDQELVDLPLRQRMPAGGLADVDALRLGVGELEHALADQAVVDEDVGELQQPGGAERQQVGVARPRTDQMHDGGMHGLALVRRAVSRRPCAC